ncbi:hypothetical protein PENANT_c014G02629 [Penicillium antarcticum]|uniref:Uncharacterized protein n=2 Tax=Penicillium antarcticum TaxID=416450 RepID=A0A1V6Q5A9_9EURO|nr:hypothetical protein PENANT_c014G02629 [Penicillium antarcticum]
MSDSKVPMWDSSDPERAPPPLPMNPRSMSPMSPGATRSNVSPNIQAVAAKFTERPSENAPSSYTTNPMPPKASSPERSLVKGQHKRMQSLQPEDTRQDARSEFMNYLENRSPERPLRATIVDPTKSRDPSKSTSSPALRQDTERDMSYSLSSRYLSKPILGESTPPSATMLALQNMQIPIDADPPSPSKPPKMITAPMEPRPSSPKTASMDSLSTQIHSLTDIASSLQREMMNLSRRSKDNATDLVSLKAATNARDEDIRKSLKDLSSHLKTKYLDTDAARFDFSTLFKSGDGSNPKDADSSPQSKRSYSVPRMPSPNPFAFDRDSCVSPSPISDGSAALALLEKVLREMATKEGEERLLELVEEIKSRPAASPSDKDADTKVTAMLEEILNLVKEDPSGKALVRSRGITDNLDSLEPEDAHPEGTRSRSMGSMNPDVVRALDLSKTDKVDGSTPNPDEVLAILHSVKNSVVEGGGMTNGVKSLVRELRGEVLGMGRELGRRLDDIESTRANDQAEDQPRPAGPEEISAIVNRSLDDLKEQLAATINESRQQSSDLSEFRSTMNSAAIYSVVKKALDELELPQPHAEPRGAEMDREDILETVREAWETYKPEIEFNNFGLERDEILTCLEEGFKSHQPQHESVTYDQVLAAVEDGMQKFIPPQIEQAPGISRDEVILAIRECLENQPEPTSRGLDEEQHVNHLNSMRDQILESVASSLATHSANARGLGEDDVNHLYAIRDEIMDAVTGLNEGSKSLDETHLHSIRDEIIDAVTGVMTAQNTSYRSMDEEHVNHLTSLRDEILEAVNGAMALHNESPRSVNEDQDHIGHLNSIRDEILGALAGSMAQSTLSKDSLDSGLGRDEIVSAVSDGLEAHFTAAKEMDEPHISRHDVMNAVNEAFDAQQSALSVAPQVNVSREEIMNAIAEGIEASINAQQSALSTNVQQTVSREEIFTAIVDAIEHSQASASNNGQPGITRDDILGAIVDGMEHSATSKEPSISRDEILNAIADGIQNSNGGTERALTLAGSEHEDEKPAPISREEIFNAIIDGIEHSQSSLNKSVEPNISRSDILNAIVEGIEHSSSLQQSSISREDIISAIAEGIESSNTSQQSALATVPEPPISREEILSAIAEGIQNGNSVTREIELNKDDLMDAITAGLQEANSSATSNVGGEVMERLQELLEGMKEEFKQYSAANGRDTEQVLDAVKDGLDVVRREIESYVVTAAELSGKDEVIDTVKEGFRLLQADMEKTITDTSLSNGSKGNPDTPELLDAMEKEFEHLRGTITTLLLRENATADKDEIIDAIKEASEHNKGSSGDDEVVNTIKQEFESLRERMDSSVIRAEPGAEKDEIISALREHFDNLREETSRNGNESTLSTTSELLDAFTDGVDSIRDDLKKLLEKPAEFDSSEILETIKDGLADLKLDMENLRESQKEPEEGTRGGELMLANETPSAEPENTLVPDIDGLKALITQLQDKIEAIESTPRAAEPVEDALKRSHLDEVLMALQEVQLAIGEMGAQRNPEDDNTAKKQDTEALEQLLMSTKAQIDELVFPSLDEVATSEQIGTLETMIREAKDSIAEFSGRVEAEAPTKTEIGTLEGLIKDVWVVLDELKSKTKDGEEEENPEKLMKSDLQTVEAMIFEVKTQVDELKLPDVETLPTKAEIQELSTIVYDFREKMEANNELTAQGFDARKIEHGGLAEKIDDKIEEAKFVVGELGDELRSKLDGSSEGLGELKQLLEGLAVTAENFSTVDNIKELNELINREFERARGEEDAGKLDKEERDAAALVKHDETRAAIIVELGAKIDEKITEVLAKYEDAHTSLHSKFSETEERDLAHTESLTSTKSLAEDIRLVIGSMGDTVNETCERMSEETKTLLERVDESRQQMEEMHNDVKSHREQSQADSEKAVAATDRVESKLLEFHPQILESVQEILSIVNQHYEHSQKSAEEFKSELSALPANIPQMLPALPPAEPEPEPEEASRTLAIEDTPVHSKLDDLLEHARNSQVHDILKTLLEHSKNEDVHEKLDRALLQPSKDDELHEKLDRALLQPTKDDELHEKLDRALSDSSKNDELHEKLDRALNQGSESNDQIYEKLNQLLDHATNGSGPVHEKLDALLSRPTTAAADPEQSVTQMMKLDEMHKDIMENARRMNEMFAAQSVIVAEDTERKRREAEEAGIALERRVAQREQVEAEIVGLSEEKDSMLNMIHRLRAEKEDMIKQSNKMSKDLAGLETALEIRHEEMRQMEDRADGLEKRILEGVLDHARTVLLSRSNSLQAMNLKRNRSTRSNRTSRSGARSPSATSTASTAKDNKETRSLLGNGVGIALKRRMPTSLQAGTVAVQPNIGKERRILSLSHVTGNRGADRQVSSNTGITNLKRSHSVKSNALRNTSWAGRSSVTNKENEPFHEEDELASEAENDADSQRKTSYAGSERRTSYAESNALTDRKSSYAPSNAPSDRKTSYAESNAGTEQDTVYAESNAGAERKPSYAGSIVESVVTDATDPRRVSGVTSNNDYDDAESSVIQHDQEDRDDDISIDGSESEDDAQTAHGDEHSVNGDHEEDVSRQIREANLAAEAEVLKLLAPPSDSGLGTDVAV